MTAVLTPADTRAWASLVSAARDVCERPLVKVVAERFSRARAAVKGRSMPADQYRTDSELYRLLRLADRWPVLLMTERTSRLPELRELVTACVAAGLSTVEPPADPEPAQRRERADIDG